MEGEQVFDVPLNANIDTETSSQLVSAQDPTLSYNPQEYQGGTLPNSLRYEHDGWAAGMYVHEFPDDGEYMKCHTTHVETQEEADIARIKMNDEYTLVKQQWDSSMETEEYWWVDSSHILQLTKHHFILWEKRADGSLHHWNGDNWDEINRVQRTAIITDRTFKVLCSSTADGSDVKLILINYADDASFDVIVYHSLLLFPAHVTTTHITLEKRPLNATLLSGANTNITSYHPIDCINLISQSKFSATSVSGLLILGIAFNKGLSQWALVIDGNGNVVRRVTGYGHVGIHGELTGGEIPIGWCNESGVVPSFIVYSLDHLQDFHNQSGLDIDGQFHSVGIVGTESQHWFITKNITHIISHMTWNGSSFTPIPLKLNNNYAAKYVSPSGQVCLLGDFQPKMVPLLEVLPFFGDDEFREKLLSFDLFGIMNDIPGWSILMTLLSPVTSIIQGFLKTQLNEIIEKLFFPNVYFIQPKFGMLQHSQMSIGQYAYVWYNSTTQVPENDAIKVSKAYADMTPAEQREYKEQQKEIKAVTDDQLSFDRQVFTQVFDNTNIFGIDGNAFSLFATILLGLAGAGLDTLDQKVDKLLVNEIQGHQSSGAQTNDRSFGQMFLDNVWNLLGTDTGYRGRMVCLTNTIAALKTLDMFYSIGDNVQCYAGVGHVSHSLQAQCVSQSILSVRDNGYLIGCLIPAKFLTAIELKIRLKIYNSLYNLAHDHVAGITKAPHGVWTTAGGTVSDGEDPVTSAASFVRQAGWMCLEWASIALKEFTQIVLEHVDEIFASIMPGPRFIPYGKVDKNDYNIEGKHKYGERSCTFMWPCFNSDQNTYTNEGVEWAIERHSAQLNLSPAGSTSDLRALIPIAWTATTTNPWEGTIWGNLNGTITNLVVKSKGWNSIVPTNEVPADMAIVEGCTSFLPTTPFKNERIGVSSPVFGFPPIQDYILDKRWDLGMTCTAGSINAVSVKDTKLIDGHFSNTYITDDVCCISSAYGAFEVKRGIQKRYLRPYAITPNILATNVTGINVYSRNIAYHGFDGYSTRIVKWTGGAGMDKERRNFLYTFLADGNIKMSNNYPANVYFGYFKGGAPVQAIPARRGITNYVYNARDLEGMNSVINNEYRAMERYSIPVFTERVGILPVVVRTYGSFVLKRFSGVTSLCTELRETDEGVYKMEAETDFAIKNATYRVTPEYINATQILDTRTDVKAIWAKLGMTYIGSDQDFGYFYNQSTHQYYAFDGGRLSVRDIWNRFRNIDEALYDFLSQDVAFKCDAAMDALDVSPYKADNDIMINLFDSRGVHRNVYPPIRTIMNDESGFRLLTLPSGVTFQGPNRCIINRSIWQDYMTEQIKENKRKWLRLPREDFHPWRKYEGEYEQVDVPVDCPVKGWTHNPFIFVTSPIGLSQDTDCMYEWEVVFVWNEVMDKLYEQNEYVCVSMAVKTYAPGGIVVQRPTHIFLTREMFKHSDNSGYYSFLYRSNGGAGNREQFFMWADGYIEVTNVRVHIKNITQKRTSKLTIQEDVHGMIDF